MGESLSGYTSKPVPVVFLSSFHCICYTTQQPWLSSTVSWPLPPQAVPSHKDPYGRVLWALVVSRTQKRQLEGHGEVQASRLEALSTLCTLHLCPGHHLRSQNSAFIYLAVWEKIVLTVQQHNRYRGWTNNRLLFHDRRVIPERYIPRSRPCDLRWL